MSEGRLKKYRIFRAKTEPQYFRVAFLHFFDFREIFGGVDSRRRAVEPLCLVASSIAHPEHLLTLASKAVSYPVCNSISLSSRVLFPVKSP